MIEKYLMLGARYKWTYPAAKPPKQADGSIVDSVPVGTPTMTFDGMDGVIYDLTAPHVQTLGLSMRMNIPHQWLCYFTGLVTKLPLTGDTLTGFMSGCPIVVYTKAGVPTVAHVGTDESRQDLNAEVKKNILAELSPDATGFFPAAAWPYEDQEAKATMYKPAAMPQVLALVTGGGTFYSILMLRLKWDSNDWVVGGIRKVAPLSGPELRAKLA